METPEAQSAGQTPEDVATPVPSSPSMLYQEKRAAQELLSADFNFRVLFGAIYEVSIQLAALRESLTIPACSKDADDARRYRTLKDHWLEAAYALLQKGSG